MEKRDYLKELKEELDALIEDQREFPTDYKDRRIMELTNRLSNYGPRKVNNADITS